MQRNRLNERIGFRWAFGLLLTVAAIAVFSAGLSYAQDEAPPRDSTIHDPDADNEQGGGVGGDPAKCRCPALFQCMTDVRLCNEKFVLQCCPNLGCIYTKLSYSLPPGC